MSWFWLLITRLAQLPYIIIEKYLEFFMGRVIITIDEIVAGRGLKSDKRSKPPQIDVSCGRGIQYGPNDAVEVKLGAGLGFGEDGEVKLDNVDLAGVGLVPGDGTQVNIDLEIDPSQQFDYRVVTNNKFVMDGYSLVFCTTYTTFIVHRNQAGVVIGFEEGESVTEQQPLNIIDGYGYGNGCITVPPATTGKPSFYKS